MKHLLLALLLCTASQAAATAVPNFNLPQGNTRVQDRSMLAIYAWVLYGPAPTLHGLQGDVYTIANSGCRLSVYYWKDSADWVEERCPLAGRADAQATFSQRLKIMRAAFGPESVKSAGVSPNSGYTGMLNWASQGLEIFVNVNEHLYVQSMYDPAGKESRRLAAEGGY